MSIDDQISAFAAQLGSWFVDFAAKLLQSGDEIAETKTRVAGLKLLKQFDDLKSQGLASLATLLNFADVAPESDRTKTLLLSNVPPDWEASVTT